VLCTIETRVLESPRGMMDRFFTHADRPKPVVWVRGFQATEAARFLGDR
jgi:hypothetical protein